MQLRFPDRPERAKNAPKVRTKFKVNWPSGSESYLSTLSHATAWLTTVTSLLPRICDAIALILENCRADQYINPLSILKDKVFSIVWRKKWNWSYAAYEQ